MKNVHFLNNKKPKLQINTAKKLVQVKRCFFILSNDTICVWGRNQPLICKMSLKIYLFLEIIKIFRYRNSEKLLFNC